MNMNSTCRLTKNTMIMSLLCLINGSYGLKAAAEQIELTLDESILLLRLWTHIKPDAKKVSAQTEEYRKAKGTEMNGAGLLAHLLADVQPPANLENISNGPPTEEELDKLDNELLTEDFQKFYVGGGRFLAAFKREQDDGLADLEAAAKKAFSAVVDKDMGRK